jgi:hypothetical protein
LEQGKNKMKKLSTAQIAGEMAKAAAKTALNRGQEKPSGSRRHRVAADA